MKHRIIAYILAVLLIVGLFPLHALALPTIEVNDGDNFDISALNDGDIVTVKAGATATITGTKNVQIVCEAGVTLTLDGVTINFHGKQHECALSFTGADNVLILKNNSDLESGMRQSSVKVETGTALEIKGDGTLQTYQTFLGAGIGGSDHQAAGSITITSGKIIVNKEEVGAGQYGACIGGGTDGDGGNITINGGELLLWTLASAGIGGGTNCDGGNITINNGDITIHGRNNIDSNGAGIGGGYKGDGGNITINGGSIAIDMAVNSDGNAGIGGGSFGKAGNITINGGTISVKGTNYGAAIGAGWQKGEGNITITGGDITAIGRHSSNGIGAGLDGYSMMDITISGGNITAIGGSDSAGIGGPKNTKPSWGLFMNIDISGDAIVYAKGDVENGAQDIGKPPEALDTTNMTVDITDNAAVILANDSCWTPTTAHTHIQPIEETDGKVLGIPVLTDWTLDSTSGAYYIPITLSYDANGGTGSNTVVQHINTVGTLTDGFVREGYAFTGWNTKADGAGTTYSAGDEFTFAEDSTLYAQWRVAVTSVEIPETLELTEGETCKLSAEVMPANAPNKTVSWSSGDEAIATVDDSGVVTGVKAGTAAITVTTEDGGLKDVCVVTVKEKLLPTPEPDVKRGNITGTILDANDNPLAHYPVTLHSDPITVITDSKGEFTYTDVPLTNHTLIIKTDDGTQIGSYKLSFTEKDTASYSEDGKDVNIAFTTNTVNIDVLINVNEDGSSTSIKKVDIIENPSTGRDQNQSICIVASIIAVAVMLLLAAVLIKHRHFKKI